MLTIAIDPSGNYEDGRGHTGIAVLKDSDWNSVQLFSINAKDYDSRFDYWTAIKKKVQDYVLEGNKVQVVIESYVNRATGFTIGKMSETAMLIGLLVYTFDAMDTRYYLQMPSTAKARFKDELLPKYVPGLELKETGRYYLNGKLINDHERDALKHLLYFKRYKEYKV